MPHRRLMERTKHEVGSLVERFAAPTNCGFAVTRK
jgi:hypothetical protein